MRTSFAHASLLAAITMALPAAASAESANMNALRQVAQPQVRAWMNQQLLRQKVSRLENTAAKVDDKPPVLTIINTAGTFINVAATDNLSGVRWGYAYSRGPSDQFVVSFVGSTMPSKNYTGGMSMQDLTVFSEPGTYKVTDVYLWDVADNMVHYDEAALVGLGGRTTFEVVNTLGYDSKAPKLKSGKILTPLLSLSDTTPGTTQSRYVGVQASATDVGNTAVAGIMWVSADFCLLDETACFSVSADDISQGPAVSVRMSGQVSADFGLVPGEYHLRNMQIHDYGNNDQFLYSTEFFGSTDFSAYFPSTTITLTP
jgi:hypothetical protein